MLTVVALFIALAALRVWLVTLVVGAIHSWVQVVPAIPWQAAFWASVLVGLFTMSVTYERQS